jgi:hypothetical protein
MEICNLLCRFLLKIPTDEVMSGIFNRHNQCRQTRVQISKHTSLLHCTYTTHLFEIYFGHSTRHHSCVLKALGQNLSEDSGYPGEYFRSLSCWDSSVNKPRINNNKVWGFCIIHFTFIENADIRILWYASMLHYILEDLPSFTVFPSCVLPLMTVFLLISISFSVIYFCWCQQLFTYTRCVKSHIFGTQSE